eukprot:786139-Pelagomonas_calceolata.AAC.1
MEVFCIHVKEWAWGLSHAVKQRTCPACMIDPRSMHHSALMTHYQHQAMPVRLKHASSLRAMLQSHTQPKRPASAKLCWTSLILEIDKSTSQSCCCYWAHMSSIRAHQDDKQPPIQHAYCSILHAPPAGCLPPAGLLKQRPARVERKNSP